jgi:glutamyl-tRNA synthetase
MPLILGGSGEKLSKRDAAVAALDYREQGYLPDGLLNYLVRLGWSHGDQEIFTRQEMIEKFDWEHVGSKGGRWDQKKLSSVQATHLRMLSPQQAAAQALPFMRARGLTISDDDPRLAAAAALVQPRSTTLVELAEAVDYFFRDPPVVDEAAAKKLLTPESAAKLEALATQLPAIEPFERGAIEQAVKAWLEQTGGQIQDVAQAARVALTGRKASPGLFEVMEVLGKERTLTRLAAGAVRARG